MQKQTTSTKTKQNLKATNTHNKTGYLVKEAKDPQFVLMKNRKYTGRIYTPDNVTGMFYT